MHENDVRECIGREATTCREGAARAGRRATVQVNRLINFRGSLFLSGHACFAPLGRYGDPCFGVAKRRLAKIFACGTRKFVAWGSRPRPGGRATPLALAHHHKPSGSARIARGLHGLDLVGACPRLVALDPRWQRQPGSRLGLEIDT